MQYRKFGQLNFKGSALGFGAMRLPLLSNGAIDEAEAIKMIRHAIDQGVNYIDTAYFYHDGASEGLVGKALKNGYRDKVCLVTKLPGWKMKEKKDFDRFLEEQLRRLDQEEIDFYLLHALNKKTWARLQNLGVLDWAEKAIKNGRFRHLGFSFHDELSVFNEIIDSYNWPMCMIQYNYMDVNRQAGTEGLRYAAEKEVAVVAMEPLLGGNLATVPPAITEAVWDKAPVKRTAVDWALQWLWNQPEIAMVLSGMSSMEQVNENLQSASCSKIGLLSKKELALFDQARAMHEALTAIACTGCGYCMPCPNKVDIPENIAAYNNIRKFDRIAESRRKYAAWKPAPAEGQSSGSDIRAYSCNGCLECESKCPQQIPISKWMPVIHQVLGKNKPFQEDLES